VNRNRSTVRFHIKKLLDIGLIEQVQIGKEVKYKLKDETEIWAFFIKYKDALSKKSINDILIWRSDAIQCASDKLLDILYDALPHPYHN